MAENLLQKLGGQEKLDAIIDIYFVRVLEDPRIRNRYLGSDLEAIKGAYKSTLGQFLSGDTETSMECHSGQGITSEEFALAVQYFEIAARELGISYDNGTLLQSTLNSIKDRFVVKS
jgi:hemoglobin